MSSITNHGCEIIIGPHPTRNDRLSYVVTFEGKVVASPYKSFRDHKAVLFHASDLIKGLFDLFLPVTVSRAGKPILTVVEGGLQDLRRAA